MVRFRDRLRANEADRELLRALRSESSRTRDWKYVQHYADCEDGDRQRDHV